jgi:hypothetical protein
MRNAYIALVGRLDGRRLLGRPECRWIKYKMSFKEIEIESQDLNQLGQDRVRWHAFINTIMNYRISGFSDFVHRPDSK